MFSNKKLYDTYGLLLAEQSSEIYQQKRKEYQAQDGYVLVSDLFQSSLKQRIADELEAAFVAAAVRRDFLMEHTGNTPRKMLNVRFTDIHKRCPTIRKLYHSAAIKKTLERITGEAVFDCPWEHERYIATRLSQAGDTHGWHWDDYAYSLIFILEAPAAEFGGLLEIVPNTAWNKENPQVEQYLTTHQSIARHHTAWDVYLFRSDKTLHRVTPVQDGHRRTILNMVFASGEDCRLEERKDHQTMEKLFA